MKYFVVTDIHGFYDEMIDALNRAGFDPSNPNHTLISCGDAFDRGLAPREVAEYFLSLPRAILIRGNHEDLIELAIKKRVFEQHDFHNGTNKTCYDWFRDNDDYFLYNSSQILGALRDDELFQKYMSKLVNYFETDNYIFVHGFIPIIEKGYHNYTYNQNWKTASSTEWERARWINGMEANHLILNKTEKTIVCGHYHCSWGWSHLEQLYREFPQKNHPDFAKSFEPYYGKNIIALDGCTAYSGIVNCVVIEDENLTF